MVDDKYSSEVEQSESYRMRAEQPKNHSIQGKQRQRRYKNMTVRIVNTSQQPNDEQNRIAVVLDGR